MQSRAIAREALMRLSPAVLIAFAIGAFTATYPALGQFDAVGPCARIGPSVEETIAYINTALATWDAERTSDIDPSLALDTHYISVTQSDLAITFHTPGIAGGFSTTHAYPIYSLDCKATGQQMGKSFFIQTFCLKYSDCGKVTTVWDDGVARPQYPTPAGPLHFGLTVDTDRGGRVVNALSHLVALLQEKYKQSHSDPSDPFAKDH